MKAQWSFPPSAFAIDARPAVANPPGTRPDGGSRNGAIMAVVLILVLVFSTLGMGLLKLSMGNAVERAKSVDRMRAFWAAEAGLREAQARVAWNHSTDLNQAFLIDHLPPTWLSTNPICPYRVTLTDLNTTPPSFEIRARSETPGQAEIEVSIHAVQTNALPMGLFAVGRLRVRDDVDIRSYDSRASPPSYGGTAIGANGLLRLPDSPEELDLWGFLARGTDPFTGAQAECDPTCEGYPVFLAGDLNPDPLGIFPPGPLAHRFTDPVVWTDLTIPTGTTNAPYLDADYPYYFEDITLQPNATLIVDVTNGPVNVFLRGSFTATVHSRIVVTNGPPSHFRVFANSPPSENQVIDIRTDTEVGLFVYAPGLEVDVEAVGEFRGGIWAEDIDLQLDRFSVDRALLAYDAFAPWDLYRVVYANWDASPD